MVGDGFLCRARGRNCLVLLTTHSRLRIEHGPIFQKSGWAWLFSFLGPSKAEQGNSHGASGRKYTSGQLWLVVGAPYSPGTNVLSLMAPSWSLCAASRGFLHPGLCPLILKASKSRSHRSHGPNLSDLDLCLMSPAFNCRTFSAFKVSC